jgi:hypothetical protein
MAETRTVNLEIKDNVKSLKTQYKEAVQEVQRLADTYGTTSREAANAAKNAADLKDRIEESKSLTDAFNPDAKFNALSGSIGGVLNGFQAYEGAMGLIGVESEELQATLLKVQSAMALSQGIQGALEAKDAFVNLGAVVKNAFVGMTNASKAFLATGLGLVIAGIGLAAANWEKLTGAIRKNKEEQVLNNEVMTQAISTIAKELSAADKLQKQLKDENLTREEKRKKVAAFQKEYPNILSNINAEKTSLEGINTALTKNIGLLKLQAQAKAIQAIREKTYTDLVNKQLELATGAAKEEFSILGVEIGGITYGEDAANGILGFANATEAAKITVDAATKSLNEQITALDKMDFEINKQIASYQKQGAVIKEENNNSTKSTKASTEQRANYARQLEKERIDAMEDGMEKRLALLKFEEVGELAEIDKKGKKAGELIKAIETRYEGERNKVKEEFRVRRDRDEDVSLEKRPVKRLEIGKQEIDAESYVQSELLRLEQEADDKRKANTIQRTDQILKAAQTFTQVYSSLNGLLNASDNERLKKVEKGSKEEQKIKKRMFNRDKALRISQTIVDTASNIVTSVRNGGGIPTGIPFGIAAGAMGALQIAAIAKAKYDGGETPSGGGGGDVPSGGGASTTPQFNTIGSSGVNQLAQLQQQPVQAYVVSGEVTSAQSLDRNRIQNATL